MNRYLIVMDLYLYQIRDRIIIITIYFHKFPIWFWYLFRLILTFSFAFICFVFGLLVKKNPPPFVHNQQQQQYRFMVHDNIYFNIYLCTSTSTWFCFASLNTGTSCWNWVHAGQQRITIQRRGSSTRISSINHPSIKSSNHIHHIMSCFLCIFCALFVL